MFKFRNLLHFTVVLFVLHYLVHNIPYLGDWIQEIFVFFVLCKLSETVMELTRPFVRVRLPPAKRAVLITGCDSGFGHLLAQRLDELGYFVFAACLDVKSDGAIELRSTCSPRLRVIEMNVTADDSVRRALKEVNDHINGNDLWAVVNNAGIVQAGEFEWMSPEEFDKVYEVNTRGVCRVTRTFLPLLKKSKGRIVNICSFASRRVIPCCMSYCMSKHATASFTDSLRVEMSKWGVDVIGIEPFFYKTPISNANDLLRDLDNQWQKLPEDVRHMYGEKYLSRFKKLCLQAPSISSTAMEDVVGCMEDAVTCRNPLNIYTPCYPPFKIPLLIGTSLPSAFLHTLYELYMAYAKPECKNWCKTRDGAAANKREASSLRQECSNSASDKTF